MPLMEEMTWEEIEKACQEERVLIFLAGSIEQHGPHLPVATDLIIPYEIARRIGEETGSIVAPPLTYGYKSKPRSGGGEGFPGTFSLNGSTLISSVRDVIGAFLRKGFRKMLVLNWHLENAEFVYEGVDLALRDAASDPKVIIIDNPNSLVDARVLEMVFEGDFPGWEREHASIFETSLMLGLKPELVRSERIIDDEARVTLPYEIIPAPDGVIPESGVLWHATKASKAKGEAIRDSLIDALVKIIDKEF